MEKCEFGKDSVQFLGHVVSKDGLEMKEDKIKAIKDWPTPTCLKELQSFLGLVNYYRRFISHFSESARPMTDLLKKDSPFNWTDTQETAFKELKYKL